MTTVLSDLAGAGIELGVRDGQLRFRSMTGQPVPAELRQRILTNKYALLAALTSPPAGPCSHTTVAAGIDRETVWWPDVVPEGTAPVLVIPPAQCVSPVACSRLGVCDRCMRGEPCGW